MLVMTKPKRVMQLQPGLTYWCSSSKYGTVQVKVIGEDETHVICTIRGIDHIGIGIRKSEAAFFNERP